jgi:hypothetical protein
VAVSLCVLVNVRVCGFFIVRKLILVKVEAFRCRKSSCPKAIFKGIQVETLLFTTICLVVIRL